MDTYELKPKSARVNLKYRIVAVLCVAALCFLFQFGCRILSANPSERSSRLPTLAIDSGIFTVLWILAMVFLPKSARLANYKLLVDEESMTGVTEYTIWMRRFVKRTTVRKNRVRTIFEIKTTAFHPGGLLISERSMLVARMLGWVYLSKDLPKYDDLRQLVEGWRSVKLPSERGN
jgi:hypothetical protein